MQLGHAREAILWHASNHDYIACEHVPLFHSRQAVNTEPRVVEIWLGLVPHAITINIREVPQTADASNNLEALHGGKHAANFCPTNIFCSLAGDGLTFATLLLCRFKLMFSSQMCL